MKQKKQYTGTYLCQRIVQMSDVTPSHVNIAE